MKNSAVGEIWFPGRLRGGELSANRIGHGESPSRARTARRAEAPGWLEVKIRGPGVREGSLRSQVVQPGPGHECALSRPRIKT